LVKIVMRKALDQGKSFFVAYTTVRSTNAIHPAYTTRSTFGDGYQCRPRLVLDLLQLCPQP
jgi:hypothetical protein